jgi:aryl-alcohol dehydrogenase (NADP+)
MAVGLKARHGNFLFLPPMTPGAPAMSDMPHRTLGRSGSPVTALCLGAMNFGDPTPEAEARNIIDAAYDQGVRFVDTASNYTGGKSEAILGPALAAHRGDWLIASKVGTNVGPRPEQRGLSRRYVMSTLETSLKRLQTDYIDLYYVHRADPRTPWEEVVQTFGDAIRAGKIRYWGLSNVRAWQIAHIVHLARQMGVPQPVVLQPYYNLLNRQPEVEVLPAAREFGLGVVSYSPIARGILSGKYQLNVTPDADSRVGRRDKRVIEAEWRPESLEIAQKLKVHAEARGLTLVAFATAWVLNNKAVTSVIAGPRTLAQWQGYAPALTYKWTKEDEDVVNTLVPPGHPSTPGHTDPSYPVEGRFPAVG